MPQALPSSLPSSSSPSRGFSLYSFVPVPESQGGINEPIELAFDPDDSQYYFDNPVYAEDSMPVNQRAEEAHQDVETSTIPSSQGVWTQNTCLSKPSLPTQQQGSHHSPSTLKRKASSTLKRSRGPSLSDKTSSAESTILKVPPMIVSIRKAVFMLQDKIYWTADQYNELWPFMDNFWVRNQTRPVTKKHSIVSYWYCRLWHGPTETEGNGKRAKKLRNVDACSMKMRMFQQFSSDNSTLISVSLALHGDKNGCTEHNHTLEYMDQIKLNSYVRNAVAEQVKLGYPVAIIKKLVTGVNHSANKMALIEAGGGRLTLNDIHNAGASERARNSHSRATK